MDPRGVEACEAIRALARRVGLDAAVPALEDALREPLAGDRIAWAELALELGEWERAQQILKAAVAAGEPDASQRLLALEQALGSHSDVEPVFAAPPAAAEGSEGPAPADLARMLHRFAGREDTHARQWVDPVRGSGYSPVRKPLTPERLRAHLAGTETLGVYLLRSDCTVTFFVLDLDIRGKVLESAAGDRARLDALAVAVREAGIELHRRVSALGLPTLLADSGYKGCHLYGFLECPLPAADVVRLGKMLRRALSPADRSLHLEFFPKAAQPGPGGLGNLVKLPLGIHQRTGRRAWLLDPNGAQTSDAWATLRGSPAIGRAQILEAMAALRASQDTESVSDGEPEEAAPSSEPPAEATGQPDPTDGLAVARLRAGCAVVEALSARAWAEHRLSHEERLVLRHTLGHLSGGVTAFNALLGACPDVAHHERLARPLRGHPISCARIRARVPATTATVGCHCLFAPTDGQYPTPILHARSGGAEAPGAGPDAALSLAQSIDALQRRQDDLSREVEALRARWTVVDAETGPKLLQERAT